MKEILVLFITLFSSLISLANNFTPVNTVPAVAGTSYISGPLKDTVPVDTLPITNPADLIDETKNENEKKKKLNLAQLNIANRSKDHLLIQIGIDSWGDKPDSLRVKGLSRSFNMYLMFDFPFKNNPHLSVGVGLGIATNNIYFKNTYIDIAGQTANKLTFKDVSAENHFKKYKLLTSYLEAPVELRYTANPLLPKKSFKVALGIKAGTMLEASTKGKNLLNSDGRIISDHTVKEKSTRYFNGTRLSATGRAGFGSLSLFVSYQLNTFIKEGFGPDIKPYSIGVTISGL